MAKRKIKKATKRKARKMSKMESLLFAIAMVLCLIAGSYVGDCSRGKVHMVEPESNR